jgi:hypothetical protein
MKEKEGIKQLLQKCFSPHTGILLFEYAKMQMSLLRTHNLHYFSIYNQVLRDDCDGQVWVR